MQGVPVQRSRAVPLGLLNLRDAGARVTIDGRVVAPGLLFRSAEPVELNEQEIALLRDHLGVRSTIDLRGDDERDARPTAEMTASGIVAHHIPIVPSTAEDPFPRVTTTADVGDFYVAMLSRRREQFARVMTVLAECELPTLIHCAAGKDRTGIVFALLFDLLGVPDELIIADYAATEGAMAAIIRRLGSRAAGTERIDVPRMLLRAPAEAIERFLDLLRTEHGGAEALLVGAGLDAEAVTRLRTRLLR